MLKMVSAMARGGIRSLMPLMSIHLPQRVAAKMMFSTDAMADALRKQVEELRKRHAELTEQLTSSNSAMDGKRMNSITRELSRIGPVLEEFDKLEKLR